MVGKGVMKRHGKVWILKAMSPVVTAKNMSRFCQIIPRGQNPGKDLGL
jgi:hypothetical protein